MWFLIKGSVFFAAVLVVLSYFSNKPESATDNLSPLQVADAFSAATQAYQYVSAICAEKPDVCEKGADTFAALGIRAKEGARVAFELLDEHFGGEAKDATKTAEIPSIAIKADPNPGSLPPRPTDEQASAGPVAQQFTGSIPLPQKRPLH